MTLLGRRLSLLGASLVVSAAPLPAQFVGSVRTFDAAPGCIYGLLEYDWPEGSPFPGQFTNRFGNAVCFQARVVIGRLAADNRVTAHAVLNATDPEPGIQASPYIEATWLSINGALDASAPHSPYFVSPLSSLGVIDFGPISFDPRFTPYDVAASSLFLAARWKVLNNRDRGLSWPRVC
jgi:hypothetical protein